MAGEIRKLKFADGVTVTAPDVVFATAGEIVQYVDIAAYEAAKGSVGDEGDIFYNTTDNTIQWHNGTSWGVVITEDNASSIDHNTLTNYVAAEHVDHSAVSIDGGAGLSGGGSIESSRTLNVDINGEADSGGAAVLDEVLVYDNSNAGIRKASVQSIIDLVDQSGKQDDVITTEGDVVLGDVSGDAARLAIGGNGTVLTSNGTTAS